jgi:hypothetical protein
MMVTHPGLLRSPPLQYRHVSLVFCPVCIQLGPREFPGRNWSDFTGALLLKWGRELWALSAGESRAAKLIFFHTPCELWVRRTVSRWWKVSCVQRHDKEKEIGWEGLFLPEQIEAAMISASRRLLHAAQQAGVWGEDCKELTAFVEDPDDYVEAAKKAQNDKAAAMKTDPLPAAIRARLTGNNPSAFPEPSISPAARPREIHFMSLPLFCPKCTAILDPWTPERLQQICPYCGAHIRITL